MEKKFVDFVKNNMIVKKKEYQKKEGKLRKKKKDL